MTPLLLAALLTSPAPPPSASPPPGGEVVLPVSALRPSPPVTVGGSDALTFDGRIWFAGDDGALGAEPWVLDGFSVTLVGDLNPGPGDSGPNNFASVGGALLFGATDGTDYGTWRVDGSGAASLFSSLDSFFPQIEFGGELYFTGRNAALGTEPWATDGTSLRLVADITPGPAQSQPFAFARAGAGLVFPATRPDVGRELFFTSGVGATLAADIAPGPSGSNPQSTTSLGAEAYFYADDGVRGTELWKSDGVTAALVADIDPGPGSSIPSGLTRLGDRLLFRATEPIHGTELWVHDAAGTRLLADLWPGPAGGLPLRLTAVESELYFVAFDGGPQLAVFATDGVTVQPLGPTLQADEFTPFRGEVWFRSADAAAGSELWRTDGTSLTRVADVRPGPAGSGPVFLQVVGPLLYFAADRGSGPEWHVAGAPLDLLDVLLAGLDASDFRAPGNYRAFQVALRRIESAIARGDLAAARSQALALRLRVDGCDGTATEAPAPDDWLRSCEAQHAVRLLLDELLAGL